jgi:hypothetical protein
MITISEYMDSYLTLMISKFGLGQSVHILNINRDHIKQLSLYVKCLVGFTRGGFRYAKLRVRLLLADHFIIKLGQTKHFTLFIQLINSY